MELRASTPCTSLRKQNLDLKEKRIHETAHLQHEVQHLKGALDEVTKQKAQLEMELLDQTRTLKQAFHKQERQLRQARADKMIHEPAQHHEPMNTTSSKFERLHGAFSGQAFDERALHEANGALREEVAKLKASNASLQDDLLKLGTKVRRLEASAAGVPAAGAPADHARLAKTMLSRMEDLQMQLISRTAVEEKYLHRSASLGQYAAPYSARSPALAGRARHQALRQTMHLEPLTAAAAAAATASCGGGAMSPTSGRSSPPLPSSPMSGRGSPAAMGSFSRQRFSSPTSVMIDAPARRPHELSDAGFSPPPSPSRQRLKDPLPAMRTASPLPVPPSPALDWREKLARATAALRALGATSPPAGLAGGSPSHELDEFRAAFRAAAAVLVAAGLASMEDIVDAEAEPEAEPAAPAPEAAAGAEGATEDDAAPVAAEPVA